MDVTNVLASLGLDLADLNLHDRNRVIVLDDFEYLQQDRMMIVRYFLLTDENYQYETLVTLLHSRQLFVHIELSWRLLSLLHWR